MQAICPTAVVVRPANMMGDEDRYLNNFACKYDSTNPVHVLSLYKFLYRFGQDDTVYPSIEGIIWDIQTTSLCTVLKVFEISFCYCNTGSGCC